MTEIEQPQGLDLDEVLDTKEEALEAMNQAADDEVMQVIMGSMGAVQETMIACNAAVATLSARVETLESFVAHFVKKDPELAKRIEAARKAVKKYGEAAAEDNVSGQMLQSMASPDKEEQQKILDQLKESGSVPQDAELLESKDDDEGSGEED